MRTRFTAWITKYALSVGIEETEVEDCFSTSETMVRKVGKSIEFFRGNDWHRTREEAVVRAEEMRVKKLASLKANIKKLEGMQF